MNAKSYFLQANDAFRHKDYALALGLYEQALAESPELAQVVQSNMALCQRLRPEGPVSLPAAPAKPVLDVLKPVQHQRLRKVAVVVHYFYPEVWPELARRLQALPDVFDLFVTVPPERAAQAVQSVQGQFAQARICVTPNLGMDVVPFLSLAPILQNEGYELVCKLHTKRGQGEQGEVWREVMLDTLVGSAGNFVAAMEAMQHNPSLHAVGPGPLLLRGAKLIYDNADQLDDLLQAAYDVPMPEQDWGFFAGSMMWLRVSVLTRLAAVANFKHPSLEASFKKDGKLEHALERALGLLPLLHQGQVGVLMPRTHDLTNCTVWAPAPHVPVVNAHIGDALQQVMRVQQDHAVVAQSGCFDAPTYAKQLPGLAGAGIDPIYHYLVCGRYANLNPAVGFDWLSESTLYLRAKGDKRSPLMLWIEHGGQAAALKDFLKAYTQPKPRVFDLDFVRQTGLFDEAYYLRQYPELLEEGGSALEHYMQEGNCAELFPCRDFIPREYRALHPDVVEQGYEPFYHYLKLGALQGRRYRSKLMREQEQSPFWREMVLNKVLLNWADATQKHRHADGVSVVLVLQSNTVLAHLQALASVDHGLSVQWVLVGNGAPKPLMQQAAALRWRGECTVLAHDERHGLALARNMGAHAATRPNLVFLDERVGLNGPWIAQLLQALDAEGCAAAQPLVCTPDNKVWHAGLVFAMDQPLPYALYRNLDAQTARAHARRRLQAVSGGCMALRTHDFFAVGGFNPRLMSDLCDADLSLALLGLRAGGYGVCAVDVVGVLSDADNSTPCDAAQIETALVLDRRFFMERWRKTIVPDDHKHYAQDRFEVEGWTPDLSSRVSLGVGCSVPRLKKVLVRRRFFDWDEAAESQTKQALMQSGWWFSKDEQPWPLVSVVMPTFNRAHVLEAAIRSVLEQSYPNWELLVCDDGSTDRSLELVQSLANDDRIRWCDGAGHAGVSAARNRGLGLARGAFIAYLDSDNAWRPDFLQCMVATMQTQAVDAAYAAIEVVGDEGVPVYFRGDDFDWAECWRENYIDMNVFVHQATPCRFNEALARLVDWDFVLRLTRHAKVAYVPVRGVSYYDGLRHDRISNNVCVGPALEALQQRIRSQFDHVPVDA